MNIYDYFLSEDIAKHCEKIGHEFSPLDMAVIIDKSNKTVSEKHKAWEELVRDYPDMEIKKRPWFSAEEGLHKYLKDLISWEEKLIQDFMVPGSGSIYRMTVCEPYEYKGPEKHYYHSDPFRRCERWNYSSVEKALYSAREDYDEDEVFTISIEKALIDREGERTAWFNYAGELLSIDWSDNEDDAPDMLSMVFIDLPVPFEKGDLVLLPDKSPGVISYLPHWGREGLDISYMDQVAGAQFSDGSDMHANAYVMGFDNTLCYNHEDYFPIRYYRSELKGPDRFLKYLSIWMKEEKTNRNEPWELINIFLQLYLEAESEKLNERFGRDWYKREEDAE